MTPKELAKNIRRIEIRTRRAVDSLFTGEYHSAFKGQGMQFSEVREYSPGDDIRAIDWNVTARAGKPYIKLFSEERELTVILMVDLSGSGAFGSAVRTKSETAAETAALVAFSAIKNNDRVGLIVFTDEIELYVAPKKGRSHALRVIREILGYKPAGKKTDIRGAIEFLSGVARKRAIVFLLSDFLPGGPDYARALTVAAKKHDIIAVKISDPLERAIPKVAGIIALHDPESGETYHVDASQSGLLEKFRRDEIVRAELLDRFLHKIGVDKISLEPKDSPVDALVTFFRSRELRLRHE